MKRLRIGREKISISEIGVKRFWYGVLIGVFTTIVLSLLLNHSRESLRYFTSLNCDLYIPSLYELKTLNLFFSSIAATIGLATSLWIWLNKRNRNDFKKRRYSQLAQLYILLIIWTTLWAISRIGTVLTFVVYGFAGYDNYLNFATDLKYLLILIPLIIFSQSWFIVRLVYKSTKWIVYSLGIIVLFTIVLTYTTNVNPERINEPYHSLFKTEYEYIDNQIKFSSEQYNLNYEKSTIEVLKKRFTESSINLVEKTKKEFEKDQKVTMKNIVLEKIIIHNLKQGKFRDGLERNDWSYCHPREIYHQILKYDIDADETKELFIILKEQIDLWNISSLDFDWDKYKEYSKLELERHFFLINNKYPTVLYEQLMEVRNDFINNKDYAKYHSLLPIIKSRE